MEILLRRPICCKASRISDWTCPQNCSYGPLCYQCWTRSPRHSPRSHPTMALYLPAASVSGPYTFSMRPRSQTCSGKRAPSCGIAGVGVLGRTACGGLSGTCWIYCAIANRSRRCTGVLTQQTHHPLPSLNCLSTYLHSGNPNTRQLMTWYFSSDGWTRHPRPCLAHSSHFDLRICSSLAEWDFSYWGSIVMKAS